MSLLLPEGAQRVQDFLLSKNSERQVQLLPDSTATARDAANSLGTSVSRIGKSIVFGSNNGVIVAVICGNQKVDINALGEAFHTINIKPLRADRVKMQTGYVIGGVSPFALPLDVKIVVDLSLYNLADCYVAAGHPKAVVRTSGKELVALTNSAIEAVASNHASRPS